MRVRGLATLRTLLQQGEVYVDLKSGQFFVYEPSDRQALRAFKEDSSTIAAVLRRAAVFRTQLETTSAEPFLCLRPGFSADRCPACGGPSTRCPSCGSSVEAEALRCDLCAVGAEMALAAAEQKGRKMQESVG